MSGSSRLTLADVAADPACLSRHVQLRSGDDAELRLLLPGDGEAFGRFLAGLSEATRTLYAPHPLTLEHGHHLCAELDYAGMAAQTDLVTLRFIGLVEGGAATYFILVLGVREGELNRYGGYGITLDPATTCTFAPVVADAYQGKGVGSALVPGVFDAARRLGFRRCVLMGGTRAFNRRAIRYYEKPGFRKVGDFTTHAPDGTAIDNQDMVLSL